MNSITILGQNILDTWLTKSAQKSISSIWLFSCPELTKIELEAEKINTQLDQKAVLVDTVISQEVFDSNHLYVWQSDNLVNYGNYFISRGKGIGNNLLNPIVQKFLLNQYNKFKLIKKQNKFFLIIKFIIDKIYLWLFQLVRKNLMNIYLYQMILSLKF